MVELSEMQAEEAEEILIAFQSLVKSRGWELLVEYAEGQVQNRGSILEGPLTQVVQFLEQEYIKGERGGIRLFLRIPEIRITELTEVIKALETVEENEDARDNAKDTGDYDGQFPDDFRTDTAGEDAGDGDPDRDDADLDTDRSP